MPFKPGQSGNPKGRPAGVPNKVNMLLRDAILMAADKAHQDGVVGYLQEQARENPNSFLTLLGKALPLQLQGDTNNPLVINITVGGHDSRQP